MTGIEGPRECLGGRDERSGRGVNFDPVIDILDFTIGTEGIITWGADLSDVGGDGGVGVSDTVEDADFVIGVAIVGEEFDVVGDSSDMADSGRERF